MATLNNISLAVTATHSPVDAAVDSSGGLLFQQAATAFALPEDAFDAGPSWQTSLPSPFALSSIRQVELDMPVAAGPASALAEATHLGLPVLDAIRAFATFGASSSASSSTSTSTTTSTSADAPLAAPTALNADAATTSTALVPPQVLASGTWLANPQITLKTSLGNIVAELYPNAAPVTVANCLAYVGSGFYDDLLFHRVAPGFVIQGGGYATGLVNKLPYYAPIVLESNNGLQNDRGTLAMARTNGSNSATSEFFVNLADNDFLNYSASSAGYAVFGKVLTGLSVVDAISAVPTFSPPSEVPRTDVKILEADQTKQGTLHSTSGRIDLGIVAIDGVWTGKPSTTRWEFSLNAGSTWTQSAGSGFTVPQGAYEIGTILVRYIDTQGHAGVANGVGGNMIVDTRTIVAGDAAANKLTGTSAADTMYALGGNDTLDGGGGADSMVGGSGNDTYVVQTAGDKVVEAAGGGTDTVNASVTYTLPSNVEKLTLTGTSAINGTGNTSSNTITGNTAANSLVGGDGNDSLYGGDGTDTLSGGNGNDLLDGGNGNDSMTGGAGNDRYVVNSSGDKVVEASGGGTDSVSSSITYTLAAEVENLTLTGSAAINGTGNSLSNTITGNAASNSLNGGSGNDVLDGGAGNDNLTGGAGQDVFRFSSALNGSTNVDRVLDFNVIDDTLQLENSIFTKLTVTGVLSSANFRANLTGTASDSNDYILYDTDSGQLFYDADGNGTGVKVLIATLNGHPALTAGDIFVT